MAEKNIVDTAIIHRTRYEIETFVLGEHPHPARQAQLLINEIRRVRAGVVIESGEHAKAGLEAELKILEDILADMSQKHDVPALLENIEKMKMGFKMVIAPKKSILLRKGVKNVNLCVKLRFAS